MQIHQSPTRTTQRIALQKLVNLFCQSDGLGLAFPSVSLSRHHFYLPFFVNIFGLALILKLCLGLKNHLLTPVLSALGSQALSLAIDKLTGTDFFVSMALSRVFSSKTWGYQEPLMLMHALAAIHGLRSRSFAYNSFTGTIPQLNRLGYLKAMYLRGNRFSGEIPPDFFSKMKSLKKVWLSNNKFTGGIPPSLAELPRLSELHLEKNQFSGTIPPIDQPTLMSFNVSNNKLEEEIPPNLAIFNYSSFDGNDHLCGDKFGRGCENTAQTSSESPTGDWVGC